MNHYDQLTAEEANEVDAVAARWNGHRDTGMKNELARLLLTTRTARYGPTNQQNDPPHRPPHISALASHTHGNAAAR
jgi:hypothetical protein